MKKSNKLRQSWIYLSSAACIWLISLNHVTAKEENNLAHQNIIDAVESYVYQQLVAEHGDSLGVKATPLDSRIEVPHCPSPLTVSASDEALRQTNITVRASCAETNWYLYLMVKATRIQQVVVLKRTVSPGSLLTLQNVEVVEMDKNLIRTSTFSDITSVLGARMKKRSRAGQPVVPGQLCFVCKGDSITITANMAGLRIKTTGIALQDGNVGDTIAVNNAKTNRTVHAQVVNTNQVAVQI